MQSLQAMSKVPTQSSNLPPLQNLPSWSRNSLGRRKPPRPIIRDRLQPIKSIREEMDEIGEDKSKGKANLPGRIVSAPSRGHELDGAQRIENIEKRIDYLRAQHAETLTNLHNEIERLKAENKELNFKLVMARTGVNLAKDDVSSVPDESRALQVTGSDEEVQDLLTETLDVSKSRHEEKPPLQHPVKETSSKSTLQQASGSSAKRNKRSGSGKKGAAVKATPTPPLSAKSLNTKPKSSGRSKTKSQHSHEQQHSNLSSPYAFSLNSTPPSGVKQGVSVGQSVLVVTIKDKTVKVHMPTDSAPRSPTLVECKAIIKHQQETNKRQEQELSKLKSDLNDALYSDKWTPDAYLLAKSYMAEEMPSTARHNTPATRSLPRLHSREQTHSGRLAAGRLHYVSESVSLPVLRPNGAANVADRKRRQQAVVRGRAGKKDF